MMKRHLALAAFAALAGCAGMRPPQTFPDVDWKASQGVVVVARTQPGGYLPQFPACLKPDVLCMDPPPFWFRARILDVVFGSIGRTSIVAATTSHYGMEQFGQHGKASLIRLAVAGSAIVMPRYAEAVLHADRSGALFIVLDDPDPIWWLPCSVVETVVDIDPGQFADDLLIPADFLSEDEIARRGSFLHRTDTGFSPRKAIPVSGLEQHLRSRYAGQELPACQAE